MYVSLESSQCSRQVSSSAISVPDWCLAYDSNDDECVSGSPDLDPFGHTEKEGEGEGCKNWTFFMDVINVWSLTKMNYLKRYYWHILPIHFTHDG